jgi:hypothetical protein
VKLVWLDPSGQRLQHYLDLSVSHGSEERKWGVRNHPNNVQRIIWMNAAAGTYEVLVEALLLIDQPPQQPEASPGARHTGFFGREGGFSTFYVCVANLKVEYVEGMMMR